MTYCVGLALADGFVLLSDTRTNAGVDNISIFSKMHSFQIEGERCVFLLTAGNLALSQAVVNLLHEGIENGERLETLYTVPTPFRAAQLVGDAVRHVYASDGAALQTQNVTFDVSVLLAAEIRGRGMRMFQVYSAGNFIEATPDTPFLQIGEHKYGKPILDRVVQHDTDLMDGVKLVLVSMDSTLRSNITVGMPIDLLVYRRGAFAPELKRRITEDDAYLQMIRERWSAALRETYRAIPRPAWRD
jgi:putative proteasome-type protease